jgi:hypothetical protein
VLGEAKLTRAGLQVFGSPPYIAPEAAIGEPIDARADLYSVGIVLFEMLTGNVPFDHEDTATLLRMHVTDAVPALRIAAPDRHFWPELEALVAGALAKVPDQRYASAMAMHAAINNVMRAVEEAPQQRYGESRTEVEASAFGAATSIPSPSVLAAMPRRDPSQARVTDDGFDPRPPELRYPILKGDRPATPEPVRQEPPSGFSRFLDRTRRFFRETLAAARRHPRRTAAIATGSVALLLILVIAVGGSSSSSASSKSPGSNSNEPVAKLTPPVTPGPTDAGDDGKAKPWLEQGNAELAKKHYARSVAAFERALGADRAVGRDAKVRVAIATISARGDAVTSTVAMELLARLDPPDTKTIAWLAGVARSSDIRRRAFAIAERDGFVPSIDRLAAWTLDLKQLAGCDERRETIAKLRELGDAKAVDALKAIKQPCVAKELAEAIEHLAPAAPP